MLAKLTRSNHDVIKICEKADFKFPLGLPIFENTVLLLAHYLFQSSKNNLLVNEEGLFCHLTTSPSYHVSELKYMLLRVAIPVRNTCNSENNAQWIYFILFCFVFI